MTDDTRLTALRAPFPAGTVGKLPKGGTTLDYVGHAAVTDRLLTVDQRWTWEPLATDEQGLPALDAAGNLWIRLTICGVTRIGVGDGRSMKERIGDAIRNAAMRFGVALDLWSKDELESGHHETKPREWQPARPGPQPPDPGEAMKPATRGRMFALLTERGITERDDQIRGISAVIGRPIESRSDLTDAEGLAVIASLRTNGDPA